MAEEHHGNKRDAINENIPKKNLGVFHREEMRYIFLIQEQISDEGIRLRLCNLLLGYFKEALRYKCCYMLCRSLMVLLPAAIMVLTSANYGLALWVDEEWGSALNLAVAILAGITVFAGSAEAMGHWYEKWMECCKKTALVKRELSLYLVGAAPYGSLAFRDEAFAAAMEAIAISEGAYRSIHKSTEEGYQKLLIDANRENAAL